MSARVQVSLSGPAATQLPTAPGVAPAIRAATNVPSGAVLVTGPEKKASPSSPVNVTGTSPNTVGAPSTPSTHEADVSSSTVAVSPEPPVARNVTRVSVPDGTACNRVTSPSAAGGGGSLRYPAAYAKRLAITVSLVSALGPSSNGSPTNRNSPDVSVTTPERISAIVMSLLASSATATAGPLLTVAVQVVGPDAKPVA